MVLCARISQAVPHVRSADRSLGRRRRISFNRADDSLAAAVAGGTPAAVAADGDDSDGGGGNRGAVAVAVAGTPAAADGSRAVGVAASGPPPGIWPRRPAQRSRPARSMLS